MKFVISTLVILFEVLNFSPAFAANEAYENILRNAALRHGLVPAKQVFNDRDHALAPVGQRFFKSPNISLNGNISCQTCHLSDFGSGDGLPNAIGVQGVNEGPKRAFSSGKIVPRNALPLWGRGGKGFSVFFWDGKVDFSDGKKISQFGESAPSEDPLVVAAHLPALEIREMLNEDQSVEYLKTETYQSAMALLHQSMSELRKKEAVAVRDLATLLSKSEEDVEFLDVARAIAAFIRAEFRLKDSKFQKFVFGTAPLSEDQVRGGLLFYGKGKCANCHTGVYFSDFRYHAVPFPQIGFGKNGFGVDYGRYNTTLLPEDLYKFRTPPLVNAALTGPYGHAGSLASLQEAIVAHFDPLSLVKPEAMTPLERHEFFKRLSASSGGPLETSFLDREEVAQLVEFLKTLTFE